MMLRVFSLAVLLLCFSSRVLSQCCTANPVAGSVNIGVLTKNTFRSISYYRYNYSDTYYDGNNKSEFNFVRSSNYNFIGEIISYGITDRLTAEGDFGYYINRSEIFNTDPPYNLNGWGFSNGITSLKYAFTKKGTFEFTGGLGFKFPFTQKQREIDGVQLPQTVQSSTGAFGGIGQLFFQKSYLGKGIRLFLIHRTDINGTNIVGYKTGNSYNTSFFISKSFNERWTILLQIRSDIRQRDIRDGKIIDVSGGYLFFAAPQINYSITQKLNISVLADLPIYKFYNGTQLSNKYAFVLSVTKDFDFSPKMKVPATE